MEKSQKQKEKGDTEAWQAKTKQLGAPPKSWRGQLEKRGPTESEPKNTRDSAETAKNLRFCRERDKTQETTNRILYEHTENR